MPPNLIAAKKWNDEGVLIHQPFQRLLSKWDDCEGDNKEILREIMSCQRDVWSVRSWLRLAFEPDKPEPDLNTVTIYLNFFSKLRVKSDDTFRYLNDERKNFKLGHFLDTPQSQKVPQPIRHLANLRFKKSSAPTTKALLPKTDETTGTTEKRLAELENSSAASAAIPDESAGTPFVESEDMTDETVPSAKIETEGETFQKLCDETPNLQMLQDDIPFDAGHKPDAEVNLGKWEGLVHDIQSLPHIVDGLSDSIGCLDRTLVVPIPSKEPRRTAKHRKLNHSPINGDCETRSLPSNSALVSDKVSCIPQGKLDEDGETGGKPATILSAKRPSKRTKGKRPVRGSQPERVGPETHPLQDGGTLDVCCHPSSDHDHLDKPDGVHLVIMESEGGQQAQDSQPTEDLELVTRQDSMHQSSMAVPDFEGPREISSCPTNSVSMEDSEQLQHLKGDSNFTDDTKLAIQSQCKAKLPELPPIWAESRQEVCEAFDWFRSYQGGVYHTDNTVKGYLLSAFASKRDVFENDGRLIISHGGGKSESIGCQKGLFVSHQASDQLADDKSVRALLDNYRSGRPLVLIVDDKYALFPYDLSSKGVTYAVLGFYSIVYAWAEFETAKNNVGRVIRYKFAFRWCEEQGTPWWCFADETSSSSKELSNDKAKAKGVPRIVSEDNFSRKILPAKLNLQMTGVCLFCGSFSHQVYTTWVCLTTNCKMFWKNPETTEFAPESLEYHQGFFALLPRLALPSRLNLLPETTVTRAMNGTSTSYAFTRGIHCPRCGRLSSRYQWEQLECRACNKWTKKADIDIHSAKNFWGDRLPISFEYFQLSAVSDFIPVPMRTFKQEGGRGAIRTFILPYNRGHIHHIRTPSATGILEADKIFKRYQEEAKLGTLRFRRWPLKAHKCRGTLLTNYFSHNAGEPYQYVGGDAHTVPIEQVPAVTEARKLIQDRILQSLGKTSEFNEVLSCAYMERQKMAFHSDAEVGLGPLVAGLSLGSPALMHFRIVARHDPLYERRGILLTVVLRHGDVLVMDGSGVQEYYEHTVIPNNFRIAATARQITPNHHR